VRWDILGQNAAIDARNTLTPERKAELLLQVDEAMAVFQEEELV